MRRFSLASVVLVAVLVVFAASSTSQAVFLHNFNCSFCHLPGTTYATLTTDNACLQCHRPAAPPVTFSDGTSHPVGSGFVISDASNAMGSRPATIVGGTQSSHLWASSKDVLPAAGATAAPKTFYSSSYNTSSGKLTCSKCHNPHADANPALRNVDSLRPVAVQPAGTNVANQTCLACHSSWNSATTHGRGTHPVNIAYPASNPNDGYVDGAPSDPNLTLVDGKISCVTCHGLHYTDSDATTADGPGASLTASEGVLLKANGPQKEALGATGICNACHNYRSHGSVFKAIGCMVCHGGHNASDGANPNIFMLNRTITIDDPDTPGVVDPVTVTLTYTAYPPPTVAFGGLCTQCHDTLPAGHDAGSDCDTCHSHSNTTSFGASCNGCHGYPPNLDVASGPDGYAVDPAAVAGGGFTKGYKYLDDGATLRNVYKNEAATPHKAHSGGSGNYSFTCAECHSAQSWNNLSTHVNNNFQDVAFAGQMAQTGSLGSAYNPAVTGGNDGVCSNIYCHSNGGKRTGDGTRSYTVATIPAWENGSTAGAISGCVACHSVPSATASSAHSAHLTKGYTCNVCHMDTAANNTTLAAGAIGGKHVNATHDVVFNTAYNLGAGNLTSGSYVDAAAGACATYCHSNGTTQTSADWDLPATGACGACHQVSVGGVATGSGPALRNAHNKHVFDANGPKLACTVCHTNNGTGADHVNGAKSMVAGLTAVCNTCHGSTLGGSGNDREPMWKDDEDAAITSVDCSTCHVGTRAVINSRTAPAKDNFAIEGHGDPTLTAAPACTGCHTLTADHVDGVTDSNMLTGGATANDAFCKTCHAAKGSHYNNTQTPGGTSTTADTCAVCHEAHGDGMGTNSDVMLIVGTGFTDRNNASSYWNASFTGVCQTCHDPADGTSGIIKHYNRTTADGHNSTSKCVSCHTHDDTPSFAPGAGTSCDGCHGFPPVTNAHVNHAPDSRLLDVAGDVLNTADRSACAHCHTGADLYTYDQAADAGSGVAGRQNHGASEATQDATLLASVGYNATNLNCATACHVSTFADGNWADTALNCTACHGNPPASGGGSGTAHSKHIAAGQTCANCHVSVPTDTAHISIKTGATELARVQNAAQALADEANVVVSTWNDTNNTCGNASCHAPSSDGRVADWDNSASSCTLCHGAAGSIATGSHLKHLALDTDCSKCHPSAGANMAHSNGSLQLNAALNYNGELVIPNTAYGRCSSTVCHYDPYGKNGVNSVQATSNWGTVEASTCLICHEAPSAHGDHPQHFSAGRVTKGMKCYSCHSGTVNATDALIPVASGGKHLDGSKIDVAAGGNYNGSAIVITTYNSVANPSSCNANCHTTGNPKNWEPPTSCESCHGNLSYVGAVHTAHIDLSGGIDDDKSECSICHGDISSYTLVEGGNHQNGTKDLLAGFSSTTCANACHVSTAGVDGFWTDANGLSCSSCHGNPPAGDNHSKHIAAGMTCSACHGVVDATGTHPLTHTTAKDIDSSGLISQAEALQSRGKDFLNPDGISVAVSDAAYNAGAGSSWANSAAIDDAGNTCSNALCHDPSATGNTVDWDEDVATCAMCHGDGVGAPITTGSHDQHLNANAKFGLTVTCNNCHVNNAGNTKHFMVGGVPNAVVQFNGSIITTQYQGEKVIPSTGYGTCLTNGCHNNGKGAAPITAFTWGTTVATDCQFCHDDPPTTGRHGAHLGTGIVYGPYGGVASTNCGDCHNANDDLTMTGKTTHMNGVINFNDGTSVATGGIVANGTVTACNNCHGAQAATANANAALAKAQWNTAARLACESCHGDYAVANSKHDASGVAAPYRAGAAYDTKGHGMASTPATAVGGSRPVNKLCSDCHDATTAHIDGVLDGVDRLQVLGGNNFGVLAQQNAWCDGCHTGTVHAAHYPNTQTAGGTSDDGLYCAVCHDPHGQNGGQDAMVASIIAGSAVTGFTGRNDRASYANASFTGVCQVCHDGAEVPHFNRSTNDTGHNSGGLCTTCHKPTDNPKFAASGCSGCHGGGYGPAPYTNNYWPDGSNARAENTAGRHLKHMQRLALAVYNETPEQLLTDNTAGNPALSSNDKQITLCAYCHNTPGDDLDHSVTLPAEVGTNAAGNNMKNLWNGGLDTNSTWSAGVNSGNCSNINCHNNQTTPSGFGWYGPNASACTMCHVAGNADDLVNNNIHPNSGLHKVVNTSTVQAHNHTLVGPPGSSGCTSCHTSAQPASHINGVAVADGPANGDRFLNSGAAAGNAFLYTEGATNQASCGSTVGLIANCHSDKGNWKRLWSKDADSTSTTFGTTRCNVCHGQTPGGSSLGWRDGYLAGYSMNSSADATIGHNKTNINDTSKHNNCEFCHVAPAGPYATYSYATHHENGMVETNNGAGIGYNATNGSCTNFCHPSGSTKTMAGSQIWNNNPLLGASPTCAECHDELGGGLKAPYDTSIPGFGGGAHAKHVNGAATAYADTANHSSAANYNYGCANCHPNSITFHNNGVINVTLNNTHTGPLKSLNSTATDPNYTLFNALNNWQISGGGITASGSSAATRSLTCSTSYCHSDGKGSFKVTPNWYQSGAFVGDPCANCHLNSPVGTSHNLHNVGIHYNNVYTGTTAVVKDVALRQNAHGNGATSTTINCNLCHFDTVTTKANAQNTVCATCHSDTNTPATGNEVSAIASKSAHVSGSIDVKFEAVSIKSRAQLRPKSNTGVPDDVGSDTNEVYENWKRQNGYKAGATSHDETWDTLGTNLARPLDTATMYAPSTKNCTVACHNMVEIGWGSTVSKCSNCHTQLPK